jgi:hypothetical protein
MPFLYNLLNQVLVESTSQELSDTLGHNILTTSTVNDEHAEGLQLEGISYKMSHEDHFTGSHRCDSVSRLGISLCLLVQLILIFILFTQIASTVCGMIAYARNRRHNGIQLRNAIRLVACGITDRVNQFLMHNGLVCTQRVAMAALKTLAGEYEQKIQDVFAQNYRERGIGPNICIDNLDIEERVHTYAVGN